MVLLILALTLVAKPIYTPVAKIDSTQESEDSEEKEFNKLISYNPVNQEMYINFNNKIKAREWGIYLRKELYIGEAFSIEDNSSLGRVSARKFWSKYAGEEKLQFTKQKCH